MDQGNLRSFYDGGLLLHERTQYQNAVLKKNIYTYISIRTYSSKHTKISGLDKIYTIGSKSEKISKNI